MKVQYTIVALILFLTSLNALAQSEVCTVVSGASVIAQDDENTFLGRITNSYSSDSIFNEYGNHGGEYGSESIWNEYGRFGGEYSTLSPFNKYSMSPPMIVKNGEIIGYLSVNKYVNASISPNLLKALCEDQL